MASGNTVSIVFAGDSKSLEKTFDKVGDASKGLVKDLEKAEDQSKSFGTAIDKAAGAADASEGKFSGTADILDGLGGAFGLPTEGATNLMRSFGDLSGGIGQIGPVIGGLAGGPMALILGALGAASLAVIALYQNSETFRDIVTAAFNAVKAVVGPILDVIGDSISGVMGMFGLGGDKADEFAEDQKKAAEEAKKAWEDWNQKVTAELDDIINPLNRARDNSKITLDEIKKNLADNVNFYSGWINNLTSLTERGFGDLAAIMYKWGPTAESAVGEMYRLSDPQLTRLQDLFMGKLDQAGQKGGEVLMNGIGGKSYADLGLTIGEQITSGVSTAMGKAAENVRSIKPPTSITGFQSGVGGFIGGATEAIGGFFDDIGKSLNIIGGRARGGPVSAHHAYTVGEHGPETFVPGMSGMIVPNGGGAAPPTTVIQLVLDRQVVTEVVHDGLLQKQRRTPLGFN